MMLGFLRQPNLRELCSDSYPIGQGSYVTPVAEPVSIYCTHSSLKSFACLPQ